MVESRGPELEPVERPKDRHELGRVARTSPADTGNNRIILLRDTNGDGKPDVRTVFIDHLYSPFGVALVGNDLYVADTDALLRFPYATGQTSITRPRPC